MADRETCRLELPGWELVWRQLRPTDFGEEELAAFWPEAHEELRARFGGRKLTDEATVTGVRALFRAAGCDPTRYRPSFEALGRRVLRGDVLPRIHPLVDLNNLLSLELLVPCCVIDRDSVQPPFVLRSGRAGERMESMRGPFDLSGKPLLEDEVGPFGTPITDSERVKVGPVTGEVLLVAYLPENCGGSVAVDQALEKILGRAPVAVLDE